MRQIRLRKMLNRLILRKTDRINNISKHFFVISIFYIDIIGATGRIMHMVHIFSHKKKNKKNIVISNILTKKRFNHLHFVQKSGGNMKPRMKRPSTYVV